MIASNKYEKDIHSQNYKYILGVDEVGTGSLVGDALVAGVIFPFDLNYQELLPGLNDSKKKTEEQRNDLYILIKKYAITFATEIITMDEIDSLNIYWAKFAAFKRLVNKINPNPDYIFVDGNKTIPDVDIKQMAIVKGDSESISIAAASIIAKVDRDRYMQELSKEVEQEYDWFNNKGYSTKKHHEAISEYGKTKYHRKTFAC